MPVIQPSPQLQKQMSEAAAKAAEEYAKDYADWVDEGRDHLAPFRQGMQRTGRVVQKTEEQPRALTLQRDNANASAADQQERSSLAADGAAAGASNSVPAVPNAAHY